MSEQHKSNLAASFLNIHSIITRGLKVSIESVQGVLQQGFQNESYREGLFNYIRALSSVLNSHHLTEDELVFPYFRDKMPEVPFDILIRWHQEMVEILDEIKLGVEKCEKNEQVETSLRELENALTKMNESWQPHIQMETDDFINMTDALIPVEEQLRLVRLFAEHGLKNALPLYLTIPFMLYNLPVEQRMVFSQGMPAEILQNHVHLLWKAKRESMKPYLLE
jgi:hemerythrin-like domain-containing protein